MRNRTRHLRPEDLRGLRWRAYVRESTQGQADKGTPLTRQRADIEKAAGELGMIPAEPVWYERVGSGETEQAPELQEALEAARRHEYDVLVLFHSSRLARDRVEAGIVKRDFAKAGAILYFVAQRLVSGTYTGALAEGMGEVIDSYENETRRLYIAGGLRERQLAGKFIGRIPFGYRRRLADFPDGSRHWDGGLEVDPAEAPGVRLAFDRWLAGDPYRRIVLALNAAGYRSRMGEPWAVRAVKVMLANPVYTGRLVRYRRSHPDHYFPEDDPSDGRREVGRPFPALVTDATFDAGRAVARTKRGNSGPQRYDYPLSGILRCAGCGRKMTGASSGRRYYRCYGRFQVGDCDARAAPADTVEADVAHWLSGLRLPDDWRTEIAKLEVRDQGQDDAARKTTLEGRLRRLRDLYAWGDLDEAEYRTEVSQVRQGLATVTSIPSLSSLVLVAEALRDVGARFASPDAKASAKKAVVALLFREVTVDAGRVSAFNLRAEVRPVIELCRVAADPDAWARVVSYSA